MNPEELISRNFGNELIFSSSRSSGPGGQNINKVNTKVELRFNIIETLLFSEIEKELILKKLKKRINKDGELIFVSQSERTQIGNKRAVTENFFIALAKALTVPVKRRATKPTYASKVKRLEGKRSVGNKKKLRRISDDSSE